MPIEKVFTDQLQRTVKVNWPPQRIISLVPSQTELLFDLGLDSQITGVTKFCIHPEDKVSGKTKIGGTKQLDIALISKLKPDLIIANKEENERLQIETLSENFPVWISDIFNLEDALDMIRRLGELTDKTEEAIHLSAFIANKFETLHQSTKLIKAAYFIWRKPYMAAGKNTFIDHMLSRCEFENAFSESRYPEISEARLIEAAPDVIFLSSEPYPFKEKHLLEFQQLVPNAKIQLVDGEMFSWYGSRLRYAPAYFSGLINSINVK